MIDKQDLYSGLCLTPRDDIFGTFSQDGNLISRLFQEKNHPDQNEINQIIQLLSHSDSEVRQQAVFIAGINWVLKDAYPHIKNMLALSEKDQEVLIIVCLSLIYYAEHDMTHVYKISSAFLSLIINQALDMTLRQKVYLSLKRLHKIISMNQYIHEFLSCNLIIFDQKWVVKMIENLPSISSTNGNIKSQNLCLLLSSTKRDDISQALSIIGGRKSNPQRDADRPHAQEINQIIQLLSYPDAEIRSEAVAVSGIYWRLEETYSQLVHMARSIEKDQTVLFKLYTALGSLINNNIGDKTQVSKILLLAVLNDGLLPQTRGAAHKALKAMHVPMTAQEYINISDDITQIDVDFEWLNGLIQDYFISTTCFYSQQLIKY